MLQSFAFINKQNDQNIFNGSEACTHEGNV